MNLGIDRVAQCAQLAMLIELSSSPKPGNVDRCHDFSDTGFHHFLVSSVSAYPVFRAAASGDGRVGSLLLEGVKAWREWNIVSNTHFGSLILMIPLAMAAGRSGPSSLRDELSAVLKNTTVEDAADFYQAFRMAGARVADVDEFSLKDPDSARRLYQENRTLLDLMILSRGHDLIAREWATSYERSFRLAAHLEERVSCQGLNEGVVRTFLEALAEVPDSLIEAKFGELVAKDVSVKAGLALKDDTLKSAHRLDLELLAGDINPGSTADLIAASLFISLLMGLRF
jgi:triphosphoribosyl-dephospho-CoA synthase